MLDPWDELETLQKGRRDSLACARDLQNIKDSCVREHGKNHVVECPECWTRLINRLRDRYLNSPIIEWFSGRRAFLLELDGLFAKARHHKVDFKTIEQRIADEKKEWFRDKVRNLGLHSATRSLAEARTLQQKLNDRSILADQLLSELRDCLDVDAKLREEDVFDTFAKQVKTAQAPAARAHAYVNALFQPERDPSGAAKSQKYMDMIGDGKPVAEVINTMARDRQSAKVDLDQKQKLHKKLEELRRARAAHELAKNKRDRIRQEKARVASSAADTQPPCSVCSKTVDQRTFLACSLCQLLADYYKLLDQPTLFCSDKCHEEGYDTHVAASHECWSGPDCLNMTDVDTQMDTRMIIDEPPLVFCRECVEILGQTSVFCSVRCFDRNFQRHRERVHLPEREKGKHEIDDKDELETHPNDDTKYWAKHAEAHVISLQQAITDWQQRTEASVSYPGA
ncbi:hypothetical protein F4802DRAFT_611025 [Xylaria palmicola]|nr:hypothetical protein F4802DRAFT_611025 [Xylaria palmicola]